MHMAGNTDLGEIKTHETTYHGFLGLLRIGSIVVAVLVLIVLFLIAGK
jgi:hypothetical protein